LLRKEGSSTGSLAAAAGALQLPFGISDKRAGGISSVAAVCIMQMISILTSSAVLPMRLPAATNDGQQGHPRHPIPLRVGAGDI
jgi:hypothetical protein